MLVYTTTDVIPVYVTTTVVILVYATTSVVLVYVAAVFAVKTELFSFANINHLVVTRFRHRW